MISGLAFLALLLIPLGSIAAVAVWAERRHDEHLLGRRRGEWDGVDEHAALRAELRRELPTRGRR